MVFKLLKNKVEGMYHKMHGPTEYKSDVAGCILDTIYHQYK